MLNIKYWFIIIKIVYEGLSCHNFYMILLDMLKAYSFTQNEF